MPNRISKHIGRLKRLIIKYNLAGLLLASIIFLVAGIELLSWELQDWKDYFTRIYPILNTLVIWLFAFSYLLKLIFFKSCIYTKIVVVLYLIIQTINLIAIYYRMNWKLYDEIVYPILLFGILSITILKFAKWVFLRR
jgi:hypothetical protein